MKKLGSISFNVFMYLVLAFTVLVSVFPILWVVASAFKTNAEILGSPFAPPTRVGFGAFAYLFTKYDFLRYTLNSILISVGATVASLLCYAMGAYVIAKYKFPGRNVLFVLFTLTLLVSGQSKAQPIFSLIMGLGLYDTRFGLALVYLSGGMAMSFFILRSTFLAVPDSLNEAAFLEGAGFFKTFWSINLPLAQNGLATAGILMFLNNWNEYFFASLLTSSDKSRTLPIALQFFNEAFSYDYTKMFAALTLVVLPGILIYALAEKQVQASVAASGIKG